MEFKKYFDLERCKIIETNISKEDILSIIAKDTHSKLKDVSKEEILEKLKEREKIGSTAFGKNIAIPHCSFENLDNFIVGVIICKKGIDFNSLDGKPTKIFTYIIGNKKERQKHIQILSFLSRKLNDKNNRDELLKSNKPEEIYNYFTKDNTNKDSENEINKHYEYAGINIVLKESSLLEEILQTITEYPCSSISVMESKDSSNYLQKLPLFSAFWNEDNKNHDQYFINFTIRKELANDIIRRINTISKYDDLVISGYNLFYNNGKIDL